MPSVYFISIYHHDKLCLMCLLETECIICSVNIKIRESFYHSVLTFSSVISFPMGRLDIAECGIAGFIVL